MPQESLANQILAYLQQEETDYAGAASKFGADAIPILKDIINGSDVMLASKAVYLASMLKSPDKADALMAASKHPSSIVRVAAAAASDKLEVGKAEQVLSNLVGDSDIGVAKYSLRSIKAKGLGKNFKAKIKTMSESHSNDQIKTVAKSMMKAMK